MNLAFTEEYGIYRILMCKDCRLSFTDPMQAGDRTFYKGCIVYERTDSVTISEHSRSAAKKSNRRLLGLIPKEGRVLDIGCGLGVFVKYALEQGYDAYGVDFNDEHIHLGQKVLGLGERLILGDVKDLHNRNCFSKSFDLITLFEVIEHVEDPGQLIKSTYKMLSKGGLLAISCPNEARWQPTGRVFADYPPHHLTRWRPDTLRSFLGNHGFEHIKTELDCRFSNLIWVAYVNRSAKRKQAQSAPDDGCEKVAGSVNLRRLKRTVFSLIRLLSMPLDLVLKAAGIGTLGMRMVVKKA